MTDDSERGPSLAAAGYQALRSRIVSTEYRPGGRLKLDELQRTLGLSSSPLREALNRLVAEGLVEADDGRGFRAAQISSSELEELTHLRLLLEGDALRRSVAVGDDDWEGRVVSAYHKLRRSAERFVEGAEPTRNDLEDWSKRHHDFHMALLSGCGYPRLLQLCGVLFDQAERYRCIARMSRQPREKMQEHKRLQEAALNRDADKAVELLTGHIQKTTDRVLSFLQTESMLPVLNGDKQRS